MNIFPQRPPTPTSWKHGQSGNPAGTWRKGIASPNPLGRPPSTRKGLDAQVRELFALAIEQGHTEYPFEAVLTLAGRSRLGFRFIIGRGLQARYWRMWHEMTGEETAPAVSYWWSDDERDAPAGPV